VALSAAVQTGNEGEAPERRLSIYHPEEWPDLLSTAQVAELLAISRETATGLVRRGELDATHVGRELRIAAQSVWRFVPESIRAQWPAGRWSSPERSKEK
jgi:excisionase family DNA binding protein